MIGTMQSSTTVRYEVVIMLPQAELQRARGHLISWWQEAVVVDERKAVQRYRRLKPVVAAYNGAVAVFEITVDPQSNRLHERAILNSRDGPLPSREQIALMEPRIRDAFNARIRDWAMAHDASLDRALVRTALRRSRWSGSDRPRVLLWSFAIRCGGALPWRWRK